MASAGAVSADAAWYARACGAGRLRVWRAEGGGGGCAAQEYTPDLHLAAPPSALAWLALGSCPAPAAPAQGSAKKKKKRKSSVSEHAESQYIALGTTNGKILIYSVAQAKVETVLEIKDQTIKKNEITSIDWSRKYGLFSSSGENYVHEWDVSGASVKNTYNVNVDNRNKTADKLTAIKVIPHFLKADSRFLVTASCQIRLWALQPLVLLRTMVGHSSAVSSLCLAQFAKQKKCYVVSCTKTERLLSFWDVTITPEDVQKSEMNGDSKSPNKKQRKKSTSENIIAPSYNFVLEDAPRVVDLMVRESDDVSTVNLAAVTRSGVVHYYGHVLNGASTKPIKPTVTLHVSTEDAKPMPLQCCKLTGDTTDEAELLVGYEASPGRLMFERVTPDTKNKTQVLIREDPSAAQRDSAASEGDGTNETETVTYAQSSVAARKRPTPGGKVEVPMESRLENLALDTKSRSGSAVNQNLTKLLTQGLHSNDKDLIITVLQRCDAEVAIRTVSGMQVKYVPALLEQLTEMVSRKTSQCKAACVWLSALIRCHSALLMATLNTSDTSDKFSQLLAVMTQRRSHLCQLLNLKGRLDLTITQREETNRNEDNEPVLDFVDTSSSSSLSDMEVDKAWESDASDSAGWDDKDSSDERESGD